MMTDDPTRSMDESGQGPKRAVAVAVPCPLGIQPKIRSTENSSSKKPAARVVGYKRYFRTTEVGEWWRAAEGRGSARHNYGLLLLQNT